MLDLLAGQLAPDAPRGLGRQMTGGGQKVKRRRLDFYQTPPDATRAFVAAERAALRRYPLIWEPCGRGGAIAAVLQAAGVATIASDLVADPAHQVEGQDLLAVRRPWAPAVVTNPPFALARPIVALLWGALQVDYLALLLKTTFLSCGKSAALERAGLGPTRRYDLTWRLDFTGGGNPTMDCTWFVWDRVDPHRDFALLDREGLIQSAPQLL
jgi:hypothetical protein